MIDARRGTTALLAVAAAASLFLLGPWLWRMVQAPDAAGTAPLVLALRCATGTSGTLVAEGAGGKVRDRAATLCASGDIVLPGFSPEGLVTVSFTPPDGVPVQVELGLAAGISAGPDHWFGVLELAPAPPHLAVGQL